MDLKEKYREGKVIAIELMRQGKIKEYIEKLKELEVYKMQMFSIGFAN